MNIVIKVGDVVIPAVLNNTVAAKDFETRLPFTVSGFDSGTDYCCTASEGKCDDKERQDGWKNGDINIANGWFSILYAGEEKSKQYKNLMIIGHIAEENLHLVRSLPEKTTLTVEKAE